MTSPSLMARSMEILATKQFSGAIDAWREYLCLNRLPDGSLEISSRSRELLGYENEWFGDPVWPEGYDLDGDDYDVLPVTVGGKRVLGRDGCGVVGEDLQPHTDDSVAVFRPGEIANAEEWLRGYGWGSCPDFETIMQRLREGLQGATP